MPFLASLVPHLTSLSGLRSTSCWTIPSHLSLLEGQDPWDITQDPKTFHFVSPPKLSIAQRWERDYGVSGAFSSNVIASGPSGVVRGYGTENPSLPPVLTHLNQLGASLIDELAVAPKLRRNFRRQGTIPPGEIYGTNVADAVARGWHSVATPLRRYARLEFDVRKFAGMADTRRRRHVFVNLMEAHEPYDLATNPDIAGNPVCAPTLSLSRLAKLAGPAVPRPNNPSSPYLRALRRLDHRLEGLMSTFRKSGLLESSLLLIVSDHGQALGEQGFIGHGYTLSDELVRVPGYVGRCDGGRISPFPIGGSEIFDFRHLHDAILAAIDDPTPSHVGAVLTGSITTRGPASSYWEHQPSAGLLKRRALGSPTRVLRVFHPLGSVTLSLEEGGGTKELVEPLNLHSNSDSVLRQESLPLAQYLFKKAGSHSTTQQDDEGEAAQRLATWGYA